MNAAWHYSPIEVVLPDAVALVARARDEATRDGCYMPITPSVKPIVRGAILGLAVTVEGMSNCCLERWPTPPKRGLQFALSNGGTLNRLDIFLRTLNKPPLDKQSSLVRPIGELITGVRNGYVHPRDELRPLAIREDEREFQIGEGERYEFLGIPKSPQSWTPTDSETVLRIVVGFMDYFLVDCCGFRPRTVAGLIFDIVNDGNTKSPITGKLNETWHLLRSRWGLEMKCLKGIFRPGKRVILGELRS